MNIIWKVLFSVFAVVIFANCQSEDELANNDQSTPSLKVVWHSNENINYSCPVKPPMLSKENGLVIYTFRCGNLGEGDKITAYEISTGVVKWQWNESLSYGRYNAPSSRIAVNGVLYQLDDYKLIGIDVTSGSTILDAPVRSGYRAKYDLSYHDGNLYYTVRDEATESIFRVEQYNILDDRITTLYELTRPNPEGGTNIADVYPFTDGSSLNLVIPVTVCNYADAENHICSSYLIRYDVERDSVLWQHDFSPDEQGNIRIRKWMEPYLYIVTAETYGFDLETGERRIYFEDGGYGYLGSDGSNLYKSSGGGLLARTVKYEMKPNGRKLWTTDGAGGRSSGPVYYKGYLFSSGDSGAEGNIWIRDAKTGERVGQFRDDYWFNHSLYLDTETGRIYISDGARAFCLQIE